MRKLRVVITGGTGLLALNWACAMRKDWDVVLCTHHNTVNLAGTAQFQLNLEDSSSLARQLVELRPDLLVHAAALTNVDLCEKAPLEAYRVNSRLAENVAVAAARNNITLIHISTDHLFSGDNSNYSEGQPSSPLNEYGRSKQLGEILVQRACPRALILRTNFFCWGHAKRQSFSDWIIENLRAGKALTLFDDVYFTPILADTLAKAAHDLVVRRVSGIVNLVGDQRVSKYRFAVLLAEQFELPSGLLSLGSMPSSGNFTVRPRDMSLSNALAQSMLGRELGVVQVFQNELRRQEAEGRHSELLEAIK